MKIVHYAKITVALRNAPGLPWFNDIPALPYCLPIEVANAKLPVHPALLIIAAVKRKPRICFRRGRLRTSVRVVLGNSKWGQLVAIKRHFENHSFFDA